MTSIFPGIVFSLMWLALGVLASWLSFISLQKQAKSINPNDTAPLKKLTMMMAGQILKMFLIAGIIYLALRMNFVYAIVFVIALTVTTLVLVVNFNNRANKILDNQQ